MAGKKRSTGGAAQAAHIIDEQAARLSSASEILELLMERHEPSGAISICRDLVEDVNRQLSELALHMRQAEEAHA